MASGGNHHIIPLHVYYKVLAALLFLTVVTVAVTRLDFGVTVNMIIAMLVASIKAGLVLAYFMHLKYDDRLYLVVFGSGIFFLILMYFFCWVDITTRAPVEGIL